MKHTYHYATRHNAVLTLEKEAKVFDFSTTQQQQRDDESNMVRDMVDLSFKSGGHVFNVTVITAKEVAMPRKTKYGVNKNKDDEKRRNKNNWSTILSGGRIMKLLQVTFHGTSTQPKVDGGWRPVPNNVGSSYHVPPNNENTSITHVVPIPLEWEPDLYLAAVNRSINEHSNVVVLENFVLRDKEVFRSINEVHCFFKEEHSRLRKHIWSLWYPFSVQGGHQSAMKKNW